MICLPNRKRALAVNSMRDLVRNRMGAPLTIIISPWRSSKTRLDMRLFLVGSRPHGAMRGGAARRRHFTGSLWHWGRYRALCPARFSADRLLEQAQQRLRRLVRQRQGLRAQLLTDLQRLQLRRFLRQIGIHQRADAAVQGIDLVAVVADL